MGQQKNNLRSLKGKRKKNITNINIVFAMILKKKINHQIMISGQLEPQSFWVTLC